MTLEGYHEHSPSDWPCTSCDRVSHPYGSIGVFGSLCLGALTLVRTHSLAGTFFGAYLLCIGVNYVPLLVHATSLVRHGPAYLLS